MKSSETMKDDILNWLVNGRVGLSSKAMACAIAGVEIDDKHDRVFHPRDPDDLNRCIQFLIWAPEARNHFDKVAKLSPTWAKLVIHWNEVESCFLDEVGLNWSKAKSAPKTYELMKLLGC